MRKDVRWVNDTALRHNVEKEVRAEREPLRRKKGQEWDVAKAYKDSLLQQLASFEKMAKDLDRARSLRRFRDEIATSKAAPAGLVGSLELMALMADCLEPLVKAPRQEIDSIGDRKHHTT